jgi:hypothetical protein
LSTFLIKNLSSRMRLDFQCGSVVLLVSMVAWAVLSMLRRWPPAIRCLTPWLFFGAVTGLARAATAVADEGVGFARHEILPGAFHAWGACR